VDPDSSGDYTIQLYKQTGGAGSLVEVGTALNAPRNGKPNPGNSQETVTDYDFVYANVLGTSTMDITDLYSFEVVAKGDGKLVLDSVPADSHSRMYSIFGDSKIWTIAESSGAGTKYYVAGADNGKIAYSTNGTVWTMSTQTIFTGAVRGFAHDGSGTFVAVGLNGKAASSTNGGSTWTQITTGGFGSINLLSVAYGNSTFVVVGDGGNVWYFKDNTWHHDAGWAGGTFNGTTLYEGSNFQNILGIAFGNGKFVIVGSKGKIANSTDGKTWNWSKNLTANNGNDDGPAIISIAHGGGKFAALVNEIGNNFWQDGQNIENKDVACCADTDISSWTWSESGKSEWYDSGSNVWKKHGLESVIYDGAKFIIVGKAFDFDDDNNPATPSVAISGAVTSTNGTSWASVSNTGFYSGETITAAIGLSVAPNTGKTVFASSLGKFTLVTIP